MKRLFLLLIFAICGCSANPPPPTITNYCDISLYQKALTDSRLYIWGTKNHSTFDSTYSVITSLELKLKVAKLNKGTLDNLLLREREYKDLENKISAVVYESKKNLDDLNAGKCELKNYSYDYLKMINEGASKVLREFPSYFSIIERNKTYLENESRKTIASEIALKKEEESRYSRENLYRSHESTMAANGELTIQIEDLHNTTLYISILNNSNSNIISIYPKRCEEFENQLGGVSCLWLPNAKLTDNYGNDYSVTPSKTGDSLNIVRENSRNFVLPKIDIYPNEKLYLKFNIQKTVGNTELDLTLTSSFFSNSRAAKFKFPSSM